MSVKERAKVFELQSISPLASRSTLLPRAGKGSPSNYPSLRVSRNTPCGNSPLSHYKSGQAIHMVGLGVGALQLEDVIVAAKADSFSGYTGRRRSNYPRCR